ncbi:MAG: sulfite exporter TauE/SafE family protein [Gammaproteobacteria bacterium]|nr:sulfite exporter TauE/SafE family protein [Gammaproteobacteria bacterium]MDE1887850.1 sulfite exporter TauE/SafE family protein [Gammaproteobacteria bacterium]MDE2023289.1 sulfite exporter TauE/SafE family protein [Gammaproteobacteria bacterium]MDE2139360.1 sulfite exporter TauE/SafE family protein [Gammaproteobacteria bacterium]MDE2273880.1 sulfite exporter TauE/SafE family protein [Gammaproteobacteria bacterium]
MSASLMVIVILLGSIFAGGLGSLTGLGGGMVIVPLLTLGFHLPLIDAVGVSLFAVIATSAGAAPRFVGTGMNNVRAGLFLQIAASSGALLGAWAAHLLPSRWLFVIFGVVLLQAAALSFKPTRSDQAGASASSPLALKLRLNSKYEQAGEWIPYHVTRVLPGFAVMVGAGFLSALLGIGSGAFKVLAMDKLMKMPFRVSTATSNFMIGMTAATSAGFYLTHGDTSPLIAGTVILGVLTGSYAGAHWVAVLPVKILRRVFAVVLILVALQMLFKGVGLSI